MKTVTLDILNDHAFSLLRDLEKLKVIRLREDESTKENALRGKKKVSFRALTIDTKNLHFDRNEANER